MIRYPLLVASLTLIAVAGAQSPADELRAPADELRILSYNIHHGEGTDGKLDLERIAAVIRSAKPDIVAVQEVDRNVRRSNSTDQPSLLAEHTKMQVVFAGNIQLQGGQYGNAILSRFPVVSSEHVLLPSYDDGEQRGVLTVHLQLDHRPWKGEQLVLMATHFDHRPDDRERVASAARVNELARRRPAMPTILAGDINATRDSRVMTTLTQAWAIAGNEQPTVPVSRPQRQIDFVFFRPDDRWQVIETRALDERVASDHRAFLAVLRLSAR